MNISSPFPTSRGPDATDTGTVLVRGCRRCAFTILEILLALGIFSLLILAIYSSWTAILRAARVGGDVAADVQRTRVAMQTIEDALLSATMFAWNPYLYAFEADTSGDYAAVSFVARLPSSFPGSGYYGDQVVRRVTFSVERAPDGEQVLYLRQSPLLKTNFVEDTATPIILARRVTAFDLEFMQTRGNVLEWVPEWRMTNQLPRMVRVGLAFGDTQKQGAASSQVAVRTVSIPSTLVFRDSQGLVGAPPGQPAVLPPGAIPPGGVANPPGAGGLLPDGSQGVIRQRPRIGPGG